MNKYYNKLTLLVIFFASLNLSSAQNSTYMRTYNFPGMNGGLGLSPTFDGGFVGTGQHEGGPAGGCDVYIYKVTGCGSLQWYKTYGTGDSDGGKKVIQTLDGGYVVAGLWDASSATGTGYEYMLSKLDASGVIQWNTVLDNPSGNTSDYCVWAQEIPGGFITCGMTSNTPYSGYNGLIVAYNALGAPIWANVYGGSGNDNLSSIHSVSGGYIAAGYTTSFGSGNEDLWIIKTDLSGTPIWMNAYGTAGTEGRFWDTEGIPTSDGGFLIAGHTNNASISQGGDDILLIKVDVNGNVVWAKTYGLSNDEVPEGLNITNDGFIVTGYTYSNTNGGRDAFLMKIDSLGNFQWASAYGTGGNDKGIDIIPVDGGNAGYVISMNRETASGSGDYDPMFVRTDSVGNCGCNNIFSTYNTMDVTTLITRTSIPLSNYQSYLSNMNIYSPLGTSGSPSPNETFLCISCTPTSPTFTMSSTVICENETVTLINSTPLGSAACFEWVANGNVFSNEQDTVIASFPAGTYTIQLNAICGNNTQSNTQTLVVNPVPTSGFIAPTNVCETDSVSFTNTGSSGPNISYLWDFGNAANPQTSTLENPSGITYGFGGTKNIKQLVINQYNCKDSTYQSISIEPLPNITFTGNTPICIGDTVNFINNSWVGGTGVISQWLWNFGDGDTSTQFQPSHIYNTSGNMTVQLYASSDYNCADSATFTIFVASPSVGGFVMPFDTVCAYNNNGTLTLNGQTGNPLQWEFSTDGGINWFSLANTSVTQQYSNLANTTMFRVLVQNGACTPVYSDSAIVTVDMPSVGGRTLRDTTVCLENNNGLLTASGFLGQITNWEFSLDSGQTWTTIPSTNDTMFFNSLPQTTWYRFIVVNGVCPADTSTEAKVFVYKFNGAQAYQDSTISLGSQIAIYADGGVNYAWFPTYNMDDSTAQEVNVGPLETTQYNVIVYDENGCMDTASVMITVLRDYNVQISNVITPNGDGFNDTWYIGNILNYPQNEVTIFNRFGKVLYTKTGYANEWDGTCNGKKLPDGTYFYVLKFTDANISFKGDINIINSKISD